MFDEGVNFMGVNFSEKEDQDQYKAQDANFWLLAVQAAGDDNRESAANVAELEIIENTLRILKFFNQGMGLREIGGEFA